MPSILLTFDDGPDPKWTPRLLDLLSELGAEAMFFPIAPRAAAHAPLIGRMLAEGHAIGLHCHEHVRHSAREEDWVRADSACALRVLRSLGAQPSLWRTPWGDTAPFSAQIAAEHGLRIMHWTADTHDWRGDRARDMFESIKPQLRDGAIVLAHDGIGPGARRSTARETIELVRLIARYADDRGLQLEPRA